MNSYHHNTGLTIFLLIMAILFAVFNNSIIVDGIQGVHPIDTLNGADKKRKITIGKEEYELIRR
jgi:hypothetical protein